MYFIEVFVWVSNKYSETYSECSLSFLNHVYINHIIVSQDQRNPLASERIVAELRTVIHNTNTKVPNFFQTQSKYRNVRIQRKQQWARVLPK